MKKIEEKATTKTSSKAAQMWLKLWQKWASESKFNSELEEYEHIALYVKRQQKVHANLFSDILCPLSKISRLICLSQDCNSLVKVEHVGILEAIEAFSIDSTAPYTDAWRSLQKFF